MFKYKDYDPEPEDCKNKGCLNYRTKGSAYCQECSERHGKELLKRKHNKGVPRH